jgi:hypothetical protein
MSEAANRIGIVNETVEKLNRVFSALALMHDEGWRPDDDELFGLRDEACDALIFVRELLTGIDECGYVVPDQQLIDAATLLAQQQIELLGLIGTPAADEE